MLVVGPLLLLLFFAIVKGAPLRSVTLLLVQNANIVSTHSQFLRDLAGSKAFRLHFVLDTLSDRAGP